MAVYRASLPCALLMAAIALARGEPTSSATPPSLKDAYAGAFYVGVAVKTPQFEEKDAQAVDLITRNFNSISPENALKWESTEPGEGKFTFDDADRYVAFGERHRLAVIGHNLCWHSQLPAWVSRPASGQDRLTPDVLKERLHRHIREVAGRYKGKILGWDVVNEAIQDHTGEFRDSVFYRVLGKEFLVLAFKWAREADPKAELYYNDYNLDQDDKKRATAIELVKYLREQGAPIDGIGLQGHYNLTYPPLEKIDETIRMFADLGLKVVVTELDVMAITSARISGAVDAASGETGGKDGEFDPKLIWGHSRPPRPLSPETEQAQARRYHDIFQVFLKHRDAITRVTLWGLRDADSWRRYTSPLLFDDNYAPKPAYAAILRAADSK